MLIQCFSQRAYVIDEHSYNCFIGTCCALELSLIMNCGILMTYIVNHIITMMPNIIVLFIHTRQTIAMRSFTCHINVREEEKKTR